MQIIIDTDSATFAELRNLADFLNMMADCEPRPAGDLSRVIPDNTIAPEFDKGNPLQTPADMDRAARDHFGQPHHGHDRETPPPPFVPAPPATVSTPSAAGPTVTSGASPSELDRAGLPWDARIHSETRKMNADGTWRLRRNLAEDVKTAVIAELRMQHPVSLPPPPVAVVPPPPPPVTPQPVGAAAPAVPAGVPAGPVSDFKGLMAKAGALMQSGKLTHPQLAQACVACGVASLPALMQAPEKIPAVNAWLDENIPR